MTTKDEVLRTVEALSVVDTLKLALEALENLPEMCGIEEAITAIREALAEQPAQQQEPVAWMWMLDGEVWDLCSTKDRFTPIREGHIQVPLYTSSPANANVGKPWMGLTDEEMRDLEKQFNAERVRTSDEEYLIIYPGDYWAWQRAIEAKLREKNA